MTLKRVTLPTLLVLHTLAQSDGKDIYGLQIKAATGLPGGTIYPILAKLERLGWVTSHWEEVDQVTAGRPRRRYYRLMPEHVQEITVLLQRRAQLLAASTL